MVIGHHLILTGYGHWLPNDPRGSMSREVSASKLRDLGPHHHGRRFVQPPVQRLREFRHRAQPLLDYPILWFDDAKRQALMEAFGQVVREHSLTCYACAVLRNHVHMLIRKHRLKGEVMIELLKTAGRDTLRTLGMTPPDHPVFSTDICDIFKSDVCAMRTCVEYIEGQYPKHRLHPIRCDFLVRYDDWDGGRRKR